MNKAYLNAQAAKRIKAKYPFVKIGNQYWTSKNFAETSTVLGTPITNVTDNTIWASSQTLYTNKYNERIGLGDTVEQATYAAVKVSAFWCNYNNDPAIGLIYGKLYNWFAVKLIQMDIDYYNAQLLATYGNTPEYYTRRYIWRIPTQAEFNTSATTLGGASIAGGKMKVVGTTYWNSPNTGADNSSGYSALSSGYKDEVSGLSLGLGLSFNLHNISESGNNIGLTYINHNSSSLFNIFYSKIRGHSIRLIKL